MQNIVSHWRKSANPFLSKWQQNTDNSVIPHYVRDIRYILGGGN